MMQMLICRGDVVRLGRKLRREEALLHRFEPGFVFLSLLFRIRLVMEVLFDDSPCHEPPQRPPSDEIRVFTKIFQPDEPTVALVRIAVAANDVGDGRIGKGIEKRGIVAREDHPQISLLSNALNVFE